MAAKTETRLNFAVATFEIIGTAPFVSNVFRTCSPLQRGEGSFHASMYKSAEGWYGISATAFKAAMVRACEHFDIKMPQARQWLFVMGDGLDDEGLAQLVRFTHGTPERYETVCGNVHAVRGRWAPGWRVVLRVKYDADQITLGTIRQILTRAGTSVGVGAGRPQSMMSVGMGWGTFEMVEEVRSSSDGMKQVKRCFA